MKTSHKLGLLFVPAALAACSFETTPVEHTPEGPVADNATEAWPTESDVAPLSIEKMTRACAAWAVCALEDADVAAQVDGPLAVEFCLAGLDWSAERAIPLGNSWLSPFGDTNERVEWWVDCVLASNGCETTASCLSKREIDMDCEEAGCRARTDYAVTCDGVMATLTDASGTSIRRDCSRALAQCDETSPTGCTDRHPTACAEPPPQPDRCDGDVRLGCDGSQQVSYHDCTRMGGTCDGGDCRYAETNECAAPASCNGTELTACLRGASVTLSAPALCVPAS